MPGATILVVDDEELLRFLSREFFQGQGYEVLTAENGRVALAILDAEPIDLVVSDLWMPDMDGATLLRTLRQRGSRIPLILMSAVDPGAAIAPDLDVAALLAKPVRLAQLAAVVSAALARPVVATSAHDRVVGTGQEPRGSAG